MTPPRKIRVGIIGASPDRGWAAQAHIPALMSLADDFEITALSTSRRESADAARVRFGVPAAFDNHVDLVNSTAVDVVAVTVKVPHHLELATAALNAGKAVYCEWPLANGLKEAETLAALASQARVLAVTGLQARSAPAVAYVRDLIAQGYVGEVLSTTLIGSGMGWGPTVEPYNAYLEDKDNGATMPSIALGHAADALCHCLGEVVELSATMTARRLRSTIAAGLRAPPTCSGRSTAPRAICRSPPRAGSRRASSWSYAEATARSRRLKSCPSRTSIDGRQRKFRALPRSRPGVRAVRSRLSRGNAVLPHLRRRGHAPSHAGRDRDGRRQR